MRDLEAIREHFGLEQVSLVGWSYLGGVVARYAMDDPARVQRLVLVCPDSPRRHPYREESELLARKAASRIDPTSLARLNEMRQAGLEAKDPVTYCREAWKVFLMGRVGDPAVVSRLRFDFCASPNETPSNFLEWWGRMDRSLGDWDWRPRLGSLKMPVLVIHGSEDSIPEGSSREWAASLRNARLLIIPGVGHFPWLERPDIFFPAVEHFLSGDWPEGAKAAR